MPGTKTYIPKPKDIKPQWCLVDAKDKVVGRLASEIAVILMGKHRPTYAPHLDTGDFVIVVNVDKVVFSGKKWDKKRYTWFTGYTGQRSESAKDRMARKPKQVLYDAVRRMLPKSKLGVKMLSKLKLYTGSDHPHQAQMPEFKDLGVKK